VFLILVLNLDVSPKDFEGLKSLILHHSPLSSIDLVVSESLAEEIHLQSYSKKENYFYF
jgi:hypothetical protein